MQNTRQQLLLTMIDFFFFVRTFSSILPYNISLCQRDSECTRGKNQLEIKTILHGYLLLQSGRNPCILTTNIKSVECIVYRVTTNAVFKGNFVFPFGIRYIYSHSTITIKIAISVKNVFFFFTDKQCLTLHFSPSDIFFMSLNKYNENCSLC